MENLTHTLVGVMLSRAGLNRHRKGEQRFGLMMALAANAPDLDAYPFFYDTLEYLEIHRGPTHSFFFLPIVALLPVAIVWAINRKRPPSLLYWWLASMIGVLSHLLLDWTNVYGIRLFLPFSADWLHLDITNIFDPFIWLILLAALAFPALSGLVGSEIRGRAVRTPQKSWAWIALLLLTAYEGARWLSHSQALEMLDARLYNGAPAEHVHAFPSGFLPTNWRTVVEVNAGGQPVVYESQLDITGSYDPSQAQTAYPADSGRPEIAAARTTRTVQVFETFNQVPFWRITADGTGPDTAPNTGIVNQPGDVLVELLDLRFGSTRSGGSFVARIQMDSNENVFSEQFGFGGPSPRQ